MVDYYRVLGVTRDASSDDIKAAFRRLALKFHPDRHASASESQQRAASDQFKQAKEAYEVLGDKRQRAVYNQYGGARYEQASSSSSRSSTYSGYTGYQSPGSSYRGTEWQRGSSSYYSSSYGTRRKGNPEQVFRWSWTVTPSGGPKVMFGVVLFGVAVCTLMLMDAFSSAAWHRRNAGGSSVQSRAGSRDPVSPRDGFFRMKSYEEMVDRLEHEKRIRGEGEKNRNSK